MHHPSIEEIAARTSHLLVESPIARGGGGYNIGVRDSGPVPGSIMFTREEIDVFGDSSLWASCVYKVEYTGSVSGGDRVTPGSTDFDISDVQIESAEFYDNDGNRLQLPRSPQLAGEIKNALLAKFWEQDAHSDRIAELIYSDMTSSQ